MKTNETTIKNIRKDIKRIYLVSDSYKPSEYIELKLMLKQTLLNNMKLKRMLEINEINHEIDIITNSFF